MYIFNSVLRFHQSSSLFEHRSYFHKIVLLYSVLHFSLWDTEQESPWNMKGWQNVPHNKCRSTTTIIFFLGLWGQFLWWDTQLPGKYNVFIQFKFSSDHWKKKHVHKYLLYPCLITKTFFFHYTEWTREWVPHTWIWILTHFEWYLPDQLCFFLLGFSFWNGGTILT